MYLAPCLYSYAAPDEQSTHPYTRHCASRNPSFGRQNWSAERKSGVYFCSCLISIITPFSVLITAGTNILSILCVQTLDIKATARRDRPYNTRASLWRALCHHLPSLYANVILPSCPDVRPWRFDCRNRYLSLSGPIGSWNWGAKFRAGRHFKLKLQ